jgi:hypothetical protein
VSPVDEGAERERGEMSRLRAWERSLVVLGFGEPVIQLDEEAHGARRERCAEEVRAHLRAGGSDHLGDLIQQATDDYLEQNRRAERAERRATAIQTAVATLLGLAIAGGSILIRSGKDASDRLALAAVVLTIVVTLIATAVHSLAVQAKQHQWARPNASRHLLSRATLRDEFDIQTLASLIAAARHNATIADWKYRHLRYTTTAFIIALFGLTSLPLAILVIELLRGN